LLASSVEGRIKKKHIVTFIAVVVVVVVVVFADTAPNLRMNESKSSLLGK
jgi:hypothetical protein